MKKKYLSQTNEFVCSGNNNLRQHMDWFIEGKIFSPSLSLIPKPEKLWKQTEHRLWAESKPILRQENQKEKKKGIICLLWCEGLRVAVWIQGNGLIIPFELIAKTGNFFFSMLIMFFYFFSLTMFFSVSEKVFFLIFYHVIIFFPQCLKRFRHGLWKRVSAGSVSSLAVT